MSSFLCSTSSCPFSGGERKVSFLHHYLEFFFLLLLSLVGKIFYCSLCIEQDLQPNYDSLSLLRSSGFELIWLQYEALPSISNSKKEFNNALILMLDFVYCWFAFCFVLRSVFLALLRTFTKFYWLRRRELQPGMLTDICNLNTDCQITFAIG